MSIESAKPSAELDGRTRVTVRQARENIAEWLNRAAYGSERIVVERHGKPVAAIVCIEDLEFLEGADREVDRRMLAKLDRDKRAARRRRASRAGGR